MNKEQATELQQQFNIPHQYQTAVELIGERDLQKTLDLLDQIQISLEKSISDYALDLVHDLLDDETPQIVRVYWFSKGMRDYYLCIDGNGLIRALDRQMPDRLFDQVIGTLDTFYS
jgi:hypothetical protein